MNDAIKPIDFFFFFKYVNGINNSYFKSLTILYGVVLFSLITYDLKIQNPMRFIILLIHASYHNNEFVLYHIWHAFA